MPKANFLFKLDNETDTTFSKLLNHAAEVAASLLESKLNHTL